MADAATRPLRVLAGEGLVTPRRAVTVVYADGHRERLMPGRDRFSPSHTLVQQRPESFRLCFASDGSSAPRQLRDLLRIRQRVLADEATGRAPVPTRTSATPIFGMDSYRRTDRTAKRPPPWQL